MEREACPQAHKHTPSPAGYLEWHEWARMMTAQKNRQIRCRACGLYAIWVGVKPPIPPEQVGQLCLTIRRKMPGRKPYRKPATSSAGAEGGVGAE